jgi:hypothetical protein
MQEYEKEIKMKRLLSVFLVTCLVFGFSGCSLFKSKSKEDKGGGNTSNPSPSPSPSPTK